MKRVIASVFLPLCTLYTNNFMCTRPILFQTTIVKLCMLHDLIQILYSLKCYNDSLVIVEIHVYLQLQQTALLQDAMV